MRIPSSVRTLPAVLAIGTLILTGCGNGNGTDPGGPEGGATTPGEPPPLVPDDGEGEGAGEDVALPAAPCELLSHDEFNSLTGNDGEFGSEPLHTSDPDSASCTFWGDGVERHNIRIHFIATGADHFRWTGPDEVSVDHELVEARQFGDESYAYVYFGGVMLQTRVGHLKIEVTADSGGTDQATTIAEEVTALVLDRI